ncbi:hypothetical protein H5410_061566 [Solanum commersonii]|uniref:DUF4283 domain-containing protein n=1 Tax=Solanum commersonii TaxID=4109 RepID=A0A9J5W9K5_SOLCO|nr:hypothetical protein H5410_061566 [Solanum commersonii]
MNIIENLQYAVIGKISYGWSGIEELRIQIPKQCNVKEGCKVGLLWNRHILMRYSRQEDFINMMSKPNYYILSRYAPQTMTWISFLDLKVTFFVKESIFSLASAVGKPLQLDMVTINKT